jgi:hypothetical protein
MIRGCAEVQQLFRQGEHTGLARDLEQTVRRLATEPAGPAKAAIVERTIEAVARQRFRYETG